MSALLARPRTPHPLTDIDVAVRNGAQVCQPRGYCGPFINEDFYNEFPDHLWKGMGDCLICGSTRDVNLENARRVRALAD